MPSPRVIGAGASSQDAGGADTRVFRLSRIVGAVEPVGKVGSVVVPEGTDIRSIVVDTNITTDRITATLRVRSGAAFGLRRRASSVRTLDDGWDLVELLVPDVERLADEAVGYGADVVVVEPAEARAAVLARLHDVLQL